MDDMREIGRQRREQAVSMAMKRKEEYLGARVPKELRDRVTNRAKEMGIPVSILIRNTLEDAFKEKLLDGDVILSGACSSDKNIESGRFSSVIGWESIQLNKMIQCSCCGAALQKGVKANIGLGSTPSVVICNACKENI